MRRVSFRPILAAVKGIPNTTLKMQHTQMVPVVRSEPNERLINSTRERFSTRRYVAKSAANRKALGIFGGIALCLVICRSIGVKLIFNLDTNRYHSKQIFGF